MFLTFGNKLLLKASIGGLIMGWRTILQNIMEEKQIVFYFVSRRIH